MVDVWSLDSELELAGMKRSLLIVGAGGHGRVVADTALACEKFERIAFVDDRFKELGTILDLPIIGPISGKTAFCGSYSDAIIAIGDNRRRLQLLNEFETAGFFIASIIHPTAYIGRDVAIGEGTVSFAYSVVNTGSCIGKGSIINTGATVDHDSQIGDGVHISPGAHLAGEVSVGACSWIGTGATVIPRINIGDDVIVGAGTVVIRDIPNAVTVVGNPGRIIRKGSLSYD